ncbi:hypothetical protein [Lysobacter enzymogenes]|uniref:hypothetical protein n=1 Tax=Lysobacter enzymogenes TaxID=69 RepID=UPI0011179192|nr:hypothetical protein [Lysobacter enzymogenes]UZW62452.1 hypothetical protein BV903_009235 [Lysobacter enzymogenes]
MNRQPVGWLDITVYWDFYDFPRYILARDGLGLYWIFEGSFDDEANEYRDHFIMKCVGLHRDEALRQFEGRVAIPLGVDRSGYERVALTEVAFDESRRKRIRIGTA